MTGAEATVPLLIGAEATGAAERPVTPGVRDGARDGAGATAGGGTDT